MIMGKIIQKGFLKFPRSHTNRIYLGKFCDIHLTHFSVAINLYM